MSLFRLQIGFSMDPLGSSMKRAPRPQMFRLALAIFPNPDF